MIKGNFLNHLESEENLEDEHSDQNAEKGKHAFEADKYILESRVDSKTSHQINKKQLYMYFLIFS